MNRQEVGVVRELVAVARELISARNEFTVTHQPHNNRKPYHVKCVVIPASAWHESQYRIYEWDVSYEEGDSRWARFAEAAGKAVMTGHSQKFVGDL